MLTMISAALLTVASLAGSLLLADDADGTRPEPPRRDEAKRDEPRPEPGRRPEPRPDADRRPDADKRPEPRREEANRNEPKRDEPKRDEPRREGDRPDGDRAGGPRPPFGHGPGGPFAGRGPHGRGPEGGRPQFDPARMREMHERMEKFREMMAKSPDRRPEPGREGSDRKAPGPDVHRRPEGDRHDDHRHAMADRRPEFHGNMHRRPSMEHGRPPMSHHRPPMAGHRPGDHDPGEARRPSNDRRPGDRGGPGHAAGRSPQSRPEHGPGGPDRLAEVSQKLDRLIQAVEELARSKK